MVIHSLSIPAGSELSGIALCAGVGGLELGLHIAEPGYRTVCYVEREVAAAATLVGRMEDKALDCAPVWSDLRSFDGRPWRGKVSIISAGYPCQPFSFSGRRTGRDDPRHLWPQVARIAAETETEWLFCENVEGHLNLGLPEVIAELRSMGYTPKAGLFSALEVGASQLRRRVFILAHSDAYDLCQPDRHGGFGEGLAVSPVDRPGGQPDINRHGHQGMGAVCDDGAADGWQSDGPQALPLFAPAPFEFEAWEQILAERLDLQPQLFGLADGMADRMERTAASGNGVVPLVAAYAYRTLRAAFAIG